MGEHDGHRERLRKYYQEHGMDALRDYEVLELLLFYAIPRKDTQSIARSLLDHFGSFSAVLDADAQELRAIPGLGDNAVLLLQLISPLTRRYLISQREMGVVLDSSKATSDFIIPYFHGETDEVLYLLCLNSSHKLVACRLLQRGTVNSVSLPLRRAVQIALSTKAAAVILAHNHPGGLALPSNEDFYATNLLKDALSPFEIPLLDHLIIADGTCISLLEKGFSGNT